MSEKMRWVHDCTHTKGHKRYGDQVERSLGHWFAACQHCAKPNPYHVKATPPASHDAGDEFAKLRSSERHANYAETRYWCEQYRLFGSKAVDTIATLTAEVAHLTAELEEAQRQRLPEGYITIPGEAWDAQMKIEGELEKEKAHSKHLAGAVSRKIEELIAVENQCGYYKTQYSRAEQVRREACEANVKAQADMLWMRADLERSRQECERLRHMLPGVPRG